MHTYTCYDDRGNYLGSVTARNKAEAWREANKLYKGKVAEVIKSTYSH